jgi:hypothetical protein
MRMTDVLVQTVEVEFSGTIRPGGVVRYDNLALRAFYWIAFDVAIP